MRRSSRVSRSRLGALRCRLGRSGRGGRGGGAGAEAVAQKALLGQVLRLGQQLGQAVAALAVERAARDVLTVAARSSSGRCSRSRGGRSSCVSDVVFRFIVVFIVVSVGVGSGNGGKQRRRHSTQATAATETIASVSAGADTCPSARIIAAAFGLNLAGAVTVPGVVGEHIGAVQRHVQGEVRLVTLGRQRLVECDADRRRRGRAQAARAHGHRAPAQRGAHVAQLPRARGRPRERRVGPRPRAAAAAGAAPGDGVAR